jgi:deoxyribonuclease (pyrimidine dimer)
MRCNVGVDPQFLADQHLVELVEIKMVCGTLKRLEFRPRSPIPPEFVLATGHISFFFNKLAYLEKRYDAIKEECRRRGRKIPSETYYDLSDVPAKFLNDWKPSERDTQIVRERILYKLLAKPKGFWRFWGKPIEDINNFADNLVKSPLFTV